MGGPSAEGKESVAESIEVFHGNFRLFHESIKGNCSSLGPSTHCAGQMVGGKSRMPSGQHEIAKWLEGRFHFVNPVLELRDVVHSDCQGPWTRPLRVGKYPANSEQVVLNSPQAVLVWSEFRVVEQCPNDSIQFVERAVGFDAGVVLLDPVAIKERSLAAISGSGVDAHAAKVGKGVAN